ncbi:N-formylglutamate amidohydrolase [Amaricoccus solimangrovi]|uniref:N-formylglutamate amidohydrolase n=1 Tax=Amaricoccus solimangrovi TaxID=2589815 RepID=A0A501WIQ7_9RHOB|nr:N-formylglutamate amidohydrolase [Amaricoccus solimangrovi]TPE49389.1 N-formylglutamate amidohydrolase [Amaricoccus solimangrovi]
MQDPAYERLNGAGQAPILVLCDHATNRVPPSVAGGDLGLPAAEMARHIAHDIGARGVAVELSRRLDAPALLTRFSRLVIDPNRGEFDPTLLMRLYDGTIIPGNRDADAEERERRLDAWHRPYHQAITAEIDAMLAAGREPALVSIHSFTPRLRGRPARPWHVGVLWDRDDRVARPLIERLAAESDIVVGDNEPYHGALEGDTMFRHGTMRGLRHVLIEIRQDLIATPEEQVGWAARLAPILREVLDAPAAAGAGGG